MPLPDSGTERQQKCRQRTVPCLQKNTASESVSTRRWAQHKPYTCNTSGNRASRYGTCGPPHLQIYSDILQSKVYNVNRHKCFILFQWREPSANRCDRAINRKQRHHLPHRSLTTSPAIISPTTEGTNAVEPGISLRTIHFRVPGGQMQCCRQLMDGSSSGRVGCSVE